jgi:hypothetical protein
VIGVVGFLTPTVLNVSGGTKMELSLATVFWAWWCATVTYGWCGVLWRNKRQAQEERE